MSTRDKNSSSRPLIDISRLELVLQSFANDRNWNQFHKPKNLLLALTGELGELVEIFQWLSDEQSQFAGVSPETATQVHDELADVFIYLVRLSSILNVDLNKAVELKLAKNTKKYPAPDKPNSEVFQ